MKARYKYRIYPTEQQRKGLSKVFGCTRVVWNDALAIVRTTPKGKKWPSNAGDSETFMEIWVDVDGYGGIYSISTKGRVRSNSRSVPSKGGGTRVVKERIMSPKIDKDGYCRVELRFEGVGKHHSVHRLVASAFIDNPGDKPFINHIDNNPGNNSVGNLEWCTQKENVDHCRAQFRGHILPAQESISTEKLERIQTLLDQGLSQRRVAETLNVGRATIRKYTKAGASPRR